MPGQARPSQGSPCLKKKCCFVHAKRYISEKHTVSPTRNTYLKKLRQTGPSQAGPSFNSPSDSQLGWLKKNSSRAGKTHFFLIFDFWLEELLDKWAFRAGQMTPFSQTCRFVRAKPPLLKKLICLLNVPARPRCGF